MIAYIYHFTNQTNQKKYIGKTNNIEHRIEQHLSALRKNKHHSVKLQRAVNKYGLDNFQFTYREVEVQDENELNLLEIQEIEKYDSYSNGYNETLGGDGNSLLFAFETRLLIYQICKKYSGVKRLLARYYNCDDSTINSIATNKIFENIFYDEETLQKLIDEIGIPNENLNENYIQHNLRKLSQEQVFEILSIILTEKGYDKVFCRLFNIGPSVTNRLKNKLIYKDYIELFESMSDEQKQQIKTNTFEKYNLQSLRLTTMRHNSNQLTQEQINYIMDNSKIKKRVEIAKDLGISADRVGSVILGKSYKDLVENYYKTHSSI